MSTDDKKCRPATLAEALAILKSIHPLSPAEQDDIEEAIRRVSLLPVACGSNDAELTHSEVKGCGIGCGILIHDERDVYRCADCGVPFHRSCLKAHFSVAPFTVAPRTDEVAARWPGAGVNFNKMTDHARQLERELAVANENRRLQADAIRDYEREIAQLRHDLEKALANHTADLNSAPSSTAVAKSAAPTQEMIAAGMEAKAAFLRRCEEDAKARGLSGSTYVYSNWQLVEAILAAALEKLPPSASGLSIDAVLSAIDSEPELPGEPPQEMVDAIVQAVRDTDTALLAETLRIAVRLTKQGIRERIVAATSTGAK